MPFVDEQRPFESVCEYFGFPLKDGQGGRSAPVRKVLNNPDGGTVVVYFKLYGYGKFRRALSRMMKSSKSRREMGNLLYFHKLGIPACEPIAQGELRDRWGVLRNCLIITKEVTGSQQLDVFIDELEASDESAEVKSDLRRQIIISVATNLRLIHQHWFYHKDIKWRNVLVRRVGERGEKVEVFWIDCPSGFFDRTGGFRRKHGVIKDLCDLDQLACRNCSDEERWYFLSLYTGKVLGDPALIKLARQVVDYRIRKRGS